MSRVFAFIDGFNLYHALVARRDFARFRWLDLSALVADLFPKNDSIAVVLNLLPDIIDLGGGQKLVRPDNWK